MSSLVHRLAIDALEQIDPDEWCARIRKRVGAGMRPITLYGRPEGEQVMVTIALESEDHGVVVSRTSLDPAIGYAALTADIPALHCFERELHEQYDVRLAGHPWLKPIRYEGRDQAAMNSYPYYRIVGKDLHEVAVGPIHAGVIEPGAFRFTCFGERVLHLEIQLGYQHRGVEGELRTRDPWRLAPLVETIAGDTSIAHTWAYCAAIESLAACEVDSEVELARAVVLELERVGMHLAGLSGLAADIGFLPGAATYGRLRTTAINTMMRLCGSRFGRGALRPGGSGIVMDALLALDARSGLRLIQNDLAAIDVNVLTAHTVDHRLRGVGTVSPETARELGLVGMAARASGIELDGRSAKRGAFASLPIEVCVEPAGDCLARTRLRIVELQASLTWLDAALALAPGWTRRRVAVTPLAPSQLVIATVEGWRGEVVHCVETDPIGGVLHYKVQDPSLRNWMGLAVAVRDNAISDFPICNKSFDLSYCGNDL